MYSGTVEPRRASLRSLIREQCLSSWSNPLFCQHVSKTPDCLGCSGPHRPTNPRTPAEGRALLGPVGSASRFERPVSHSPHREWIEVCPSEAVAVRLSAGDWRTTPSSYRDWARARSRSDLPQHYGAAASGSWLVFVRSDSRLEQASRNRRQQRRSHPAAPSSQRTPETAIDRSHRFPRVDRPRRDAANSRYPGGRGSRRWNPSVRARAENAATRSPGFAAARSASPPVRVRIHRRDHGSRDRLSPRRRLATVPDPPRTHSGPGGGASRDRASRLHARRRRAGARTAMDGRDPCDARTKASHATTRPTRTGCANRHRHRGTGDQPPVIS